MNSQPAVSVALHDSKTQYWPDLNIKEEKYLSTNVIETNNSDQINPRKPEKTAQCKVCFKTLSSRYLSQHMPVHSGDRPYTCFKCNRDFRFISSFTKHTRKKCAMHYPK